MRFYSLDGDGRPGRRAHVGADCPTLQGRTVVSSEYFDNVRKPEPRASDCSTCRGPTYWERVAKRAVLCSGCLRHKTRGWVLVFGDGTVKDVCDACREKM